MKKIIVLILCIISSSAFASTIQPHIVEDCNPEDHLSAGFNYVHVLMDDRGDYSLAIEWNRPTGREDVEEFAVEYFDDMTVYGFADDYNTATLYLYTIDDIAGERAELYLEGRHVPITCE